MKKTFFPPRITSPGALQTALVLACSYFPLDRQHRPPSLSPSVPKP